MSVTPFPDPRTNKFIPEAWQWIDLWKKFRNFIVSYPTAQNKTINFLNPTFLTTRTALTQWANTSYTTSEIVAWLTTVNFGTALTSAVLQYYFGGIRVATIDPLTAGATLAIGNGATTNNVSIMSASNTGILTLGSSDSTIRLNCPLTPLYQQPVIPVGAIGYTLQSTLVDLISADGTFGRLIRTLSLTPGVWFLSGYVARNVATSGYYAVGFTSDLAGLNNFARKGTFDMANQASFPGYFVTASGTFIATTATSMSIYSRTSSSITLTSAALVAVRIA